LIIQFILIIILTNIASMLEAITGFGTSTIMIPILSLFFPLHQILLFVGLIHFMSNIWKLFIFKTELRWPLVFAFGIPAMIMSFTGACVTFKISQFLAYKILATILLTYSSIILLKPKLKLPQTNISAFCGGTLSGFFSGIIGLGGPLRAIFLSIFNLPKITYIFTATIISFFVDITRLSTYIYHGSRLNYMLTSAVLLSIPLCPLAALTAKKIVLYIPQEKFRIVITIFLAIFGIYFLIK